MFLGSLVEAGTVPGTMPGIGRIDPCQKSRYGVGDTAEDRMT